MAKKRGVNKQYRKTPSKPSAKSGSIPAKTNPASFETQSAASSVNVEEELKDLEKNAFAKNKPAEKVETESKHSSSKGSICPMPATSSSKPVWFYISSIFAAFLFTAYISIFATIHFESIEYMNITIVFFFISIVSYFLITALFFISEKKKWHSAASLSFFIGIVAIMVYAFKAIDTSNLVRFSIIYTIIVAAASSYVLAIRK